MTAVGDLRDRTRQSRVTGSELPFADALHRLDQRLAAAVDGIPAPNDPLVGGDCGPAFDWITRTYELTAFELDMLLVALSPEVDSRYGRAFALLQDDLTRTRPTVELTLNLLCANGCDIGRIRHVATDAPLRANRLLRVVPDPVTSSPRSGRTTLCSIRRSPMCCSAAAVSTGDSRAGAGSSRPPNTANPGGTRCGSSAFGTDCPGQHRYTCTDHRDRAAAPRCGPPRRRSADRFCTATCAGCPARR